MSSFHSGFNILGFRLHCCNMLQPSQRHNNRRFSTTKRPRPWHADSSESKPFSAFACHTASVTTYVPYWVEQHTPSPFNFVFVQIFLVRIVRRRVVWKWEWCCVCPCALQRGAAVQQNWCCLIEHMLIQCMFNETEPMSVCFARTCDVPTGRNAGDVVPPCCIAAFLEWLGTSVW